MSSLSQLFPVPFPHRPWCLFDSRHVRTRIRRGTKWAVGIEMPLAVGKMLELAVSICRVHSVIIDVENQLVVGIVLDAIISPIRSVLDQTSRYRTTKITAITRPRWVAPALQSWVEQLRSSGRSTVAPRKCISPPKPSKI